MVYEFVVFSSARCRILKQTKNRRKQTNKFRLETGNVGNSLYMYVRYPVGHVGGLTSAHGLKALLPAKQTICGRVKTRHIL